MNIRGNLKRIITLFTNWGDEYEALLETRATTLFNNIERSVLVLVFLYI